MRTKKIENLLIDYSAEIIREVKKTAAQGRGRKILGGVINRPEDLEIGVDRLGEEILEKLLQKYNLCATVFSEPEKREIKNGQCKAAAMYGSIDPFDGSILFLKGFEQNWYSALSFYSRDKTALATAIVDILNEKLYLSTEKGNYVLGPGNSKKNKIAPSKRKTLKGAFTLASYIMSSQYSRKFLDVFGRLITNMHPKALLYPYGGSFIYGFLAAGFVDAYVMFNEPRS